MTQPGAGSFSSPPSQPPVWLVTDQLPYPPRNGITLPVANYLEGLRRRHEVRLILLVDVAQPPAPDDLRANEARYGPIAQIPFFRQSPFVRAARELSGREMYYHGWRPAPGSAPLWPPPESTLIVSPISAAAKWRRLKPAGRARVSIAAVNDCTAAQYYFRGKQSFGGILLKWRGLMDRWRSIIIARIERNILSEYDHVLLQTATDLELMRRLVGETIARRVTLAPNGVREELMSVEPDRRSRQVALVSELSGEYAPVARWFVAGVWPKILREQPDATLRVIGKGADERLKEMMKRSRGVSYVSYVEDLADVYRNTLVVVSPVFKGYGLINKTIEAMAAGVPVVGGASAFNGIEGFDPGRDGILCKTNEATEFAQAIVTLIRDSALCASIGESGRARVKDCFNWERTLAVIERLLERQDVT